MSQSYRSLPRATDVSKSSTPSRLSHPLSINEEASRSDEKQFCFVPSWEESLTTVFCLSVEHYVKTGQTLCPVV